MEVIYVYSWPRRTSTVVSKKMSVLVFSRSRGIEGMCCIYVPLVANSRGNKDECRVERIANLPVGGILAYSVY